MTLTGTLLAGLVNKKVYFTENPAYFPTRNLAKFVFQGTGLNEAQLVIMNTEPSSSARGAGLIIGHHDNAYLASGDRMGYVLFGGGIPGSIFGHGCGINAYTTELWNATSRGSKFEFQAAPNGSTSRSTILTILGNGIEMPTVYANSHGGTGRVMYIQSDGELTCDTSGLKYKENIRDITDSNWILDLRPRLADWKVSEVKDDYFLIAEEVEAVNPKMVTYGMEIVYEDVNDGLGMVRKVKSMTETDVPESVHYTKLIVPMLHQMQIMKAEMQSTRAEMQAEIDELKEKVAELEKK